MTALELPPIEAVREWAKMLVAARGDALTDWLHHDGLHLNDLEIMGRNIMLVRENVGNPFQGGTNIVRCIQLAAYPDADFAPPFWDQPHRSWADIPSHRQGRYESRQYNKIYLPHPLTQPTLMRVVSRYDSVPEPQKTNREVVEYTLFELNPVFQRQVAEANAIQAAHLGNRLPLKNRMPRS